MGAHHRLRRRLLVHISAFSYQQYSAYDRINDIGNQDPIGSGNLVQSLEAVGSPFWHVHGLRMVPTSCLTFILLHASTLAARFCKHYKTSSWTSDAIWALVVSVYSNLVTGNVANRGC